MVSLGLSTGLSAHPAFALESQLGQEAVPANEPADAKFVKQMIIDGLNTFHQAHPGAVVQRDAHPKAHGCVLASFEVKKNLPSEFAHGIFSQSTATPYKAWIRYSNGRPGNNPDTQPDGRGMAIKVLGVSGAKILLNDETGTQDFVMINHDVFFVRNAHDYISFQKNPSLFMLLHPFHEFAILTATGLEKITNPFQSQYWSMVPYRLGPESEARAMKYTVVPTPCDGERTVATPVSSSPNFLLEAMVSSMQKGDACFNFQMQLQKNGKSMPIEDPTISWDAAGASYTIVATIRIAKKDNDGKLGLQNKERTEFCENLSMSPWHANPELRPLGGINRVRKVVYQAISSHRHELNNVRLAEPTGKETF